LLVELGQPARLAGCGLAAVEGGQGGVDQRAGLIESRLDHGARLVVGLGQVGHGRRQQLARRLHHDLPEHLGVLAGLLELDLDPGGLGRGCLAALRQRGSPPLLVLPLGDLQLGGQLDRLRLGGLEVADQLAVLGQLRSVGQLLGQKRGQRLDQAPSVGATAAEVVSGEGLAGRRAHRSSFVVGLVLRGQLFTHGAPFCRRDPCGYPGPKVASAVGFSCRQRCQATCFS